MKRARTPETLVNKGLVTIVDNVDNLYDHPKNGEKNPHFLVSKNQQKMWIMWITSC